MLPPAPPRTATPRPAPRRSPQPSGRPTTPLTIGKLARAGGVGVETIRFYERQGLLPPPPRSASGYRHYGPDAVRRLRFIVRAKALGFSLAETAELLSLRARDDERCAEVRAVAAAKLAEVEAKLRDLAAIRDALAGLVAQCASGGVASRCPVLEALDRDVAPASGED